jgi:hypothetical protein
MKIYKQPDPPHLIRINIKKQGIKTEHVTLCETTQSECANFIIRIIEELKISPFQKGNVTNIEIREAIGSKNGKSISLSFKGLPPLNVKNLILNQLKTTT